MDVIPAAWAFTESALRSSTAYFLVFSFAVVTLIFAGADHKIQLNQPHQQINPGILPELCLIIRSPTFS
ncbi:hypothetical protein Ddc_08458 [Ditylenchus destructor]|nr:hypothetical protein Ddc_08458 [Ditylenchus destructor]